ncbi:MAG TPA: DUF2306 domain-containing protein [Longimicrobiaceae bacterium]
MSPLGWLHLAAALAALAAGAWVLLRPKGTALHRRVGWAYAASMLLLNGTALLIYRLTRVFGPFHVAALVSLATLVAGVVPAWRRRPPGAWVERHYFFMAYSYLGLVAAAFAETATRLPVARAFAGGPTAAFWATVAAVSAAIFAAGAWLIQRRFGPTVRPFRGLTPG